MDWKLELGYVQLSPPGSACSVVLGVGITTMEPGSLQGLQIVVDDVEAARQQPIERGVGVSEVDVQSWGSFVSLADPDGNSCSLQQVPARRSTAGAELLYSPHGTDGEAVPRGRLRPHPRGALQGTLRGVLRAYRHVQRRGPSTPGAGRDHSVDGRQRCRRRPRRTVLVPCAPGRPVHRLRRSADDLSSVGSDEVDAVPARVHTGERLEPAGEL